jgi:hypothetical protein
MADRAKKISELTALTGPVAEDLLVVVDAPSTNAVTKSVTVGNFFGNSSANVTIKSGYYINANNAVVNNFVVARKQTPVASSGTSDQQGAIWFDANYIYVAVANGTVKRAALSTF